MRKVGNYLLGKLQQPKNEVLRQTRLKKRVLHTEMPFFLFFPDFRIFHPVQCENEIVFSIF